MSGHSKWAKIRHKKGLNDAKKGKVFSKFGHQISIAARDGGDDINSNFTLRLLVEKAKAVSMPADNIKRAIERGAGKGADALVIEHTTYEGIGPDGIAVIVEALTDNKNRTVADIRKAYSDKGGNIGDSGSVSWNFEHLGQIIMRPAKMVPSEKYGQEDEMHFSDSEEVQLELMELEGVMDIEEYEEKGSENDKDDGKYFALTIDQKALGRIRDEIATMGYVLNSAELIWKPKTPKDISPASLEKLHSFIEYLEEFDDVQSVWTESDHLVE